MSDEMTHLTDERIEQIKSRLNAATPDDWYAAANIDFLTSAKDDVRALLNDLLAARAKLAKLEDVAVMAMTPHRDAYDQYHDWHGRLRDAAESALAAKDAAEGKVG